MSVERFIITGTMLADRGIPDARTFVKWRDYKALAADRDYWKTEAEGERANDRQLSQASHGAVKALKWNTGSWVGSYYAKGLGIAYEIVTDHNCAVLAKGDGSSILKSAYNTAEQAKAAAQRDYETRILSALEI